jgi:hypothetical protein
MCNEVPLTEEEGVQQKQKCGYCAFTHRCHVTRLAESMTGVYERT